MLTLCKVDKTNWHETLLLTVQPEQQRFIGNCVPITAMALAKVSPC